MRSTASPIETEKIVEITVLNLLLSYSIFVFENLARRPEDCFPMVSGFEGKGAGPEVVRKGVRIRRGRWGESGCGSKHRTTEHKLYCNCNVYITTRKLYIFK